MPKPSRVVSLLPSATEILCAVGARELLVGRSHECDFPSGLADLPVLTSQAASPSTASEIDAEVRSRVRAGLPLYTLDVDLLRSLAPDVIVTQDLCEVCSIDLATVRRAAESMDPRPRVVSLDPQGLEDVLDDLLRVGEAVGRAADARDRVVRLRERVYRAQEFVNPFDDGPVVAFLEWTDPLFVAGHWTVQLIERAGGRHPWNPTVAKPDSGAAAGLMQTERLAGKSITVTPEALAQAEPEFVVVAPCGLDLDATREAVRDIEGRDWFRSLPAVRNGRVALVDGNQMFNRPGPRLVDAFEWLVGWLQDRPEIIPDGFPWERYEQQ